MNKFLIVFAALLATFKFCNAYGPSPVYGAPPAAPVIGAIAYQLKPAITLQVFVPASNNADKAYDSKVPSKYGAPLRSAYAGPIGIPAPSFRRLAPVGYDAEIIRLAELALSLPSLPAIINPNPAIPPSKVYAPAAPLFLPAHPINVGYKIPSNPGPAQRYFVDPALNSAYNPVPRPVILPAPVPEADYSYE